MALAILALLSVTSSNKPYPSAPHPKEKYVSMCSQFQLTEDKVAANVPRPEVLALKQESRILREWSNPVSGSRQPSQFSMGQTAHCLTCSIIEKPHNGTGNDLFIDFPGWCALLALGYTHNPSNTSNTSNPSVYRIGWLSENPTLVL